MFPVGGNRVFQARGETVHVAVAAENLAVFRLAKARGRSDQGFEHGVEIESGSADRFQDVRRRRLLRERFLEVAGLGLNLVEQAHILDGDDGLIGEGLHKFDLSLRVFARLAAPDHQHALNSFLPQQGRGEQRTRPIERVRGQDIFLVRENVGDAFGLARKEHSPRHRFPAGGRRRRGEESHPFRSDAGMGSGRERLSIANEDRSVDTANKFDGRRDQRIKHRLQIERRAADDLEHFGRRGLLLQRLGEIARARLHFFEQARVLDGDHRLVGEGLHEVDHSRRKRPSFVANEHDHADDFAVPEHRHAEPRK